MNAKSFWTRIKILLKQKNVTQETAAKSCLVSINTWRSWIYHGIIPPVSDCVKIAKYLNISLDYLITGKERNSKTIITDIELLMKKAGEKLKSLK